MRTLALSIVAAGMFMGSSLHAGDAGALPPDVQKIADKAEASIAIVTKSTDSHIAQVRNQEIKDLQRVLDAATKKGETAAATTVQQFIEELKNGIPAPGASAGKAVVLAGRSQAWQEISGTVIADLTAKSLKIGYPGLTGGISVNPANGECFMVVCDQGMWGSKDHGTTFVRVDDNHIGGRCETGAAMQWDPEGGRLACFMLDGTAGMTTDGGKTWSSFAGVGRGWDYGSVDWSAKDPVDIIALHHESGGEVYRSGNAGKSWTMISKDNGYNSVGLFDANTLIAGKNGTGIVRSTDNGKTWSTVANYAITNHVMVVFQGAGYLISKQGLVASTDRGATWSVRGAALDATFGPLFHDRNHLVVWGGANVLESLDGGSSWTAVLNMPQTYQDYQPAWYNNLGWDRALGILYTSKMGKPAYRCGP